MFVYNLIVVMTSLLSLSPPPLPLPLSLLLSKLLPSLHGTMYIREEEKTDTKNMEDQTKIM